MSKWAECLFVIPCALPSEICMRFGDSKNRAQTHSDSLTSKTHSLVCLGYHQHLRGLTPFPRLHGPGHRAPGLRAEPAGGPRQRQLSRSMARFMDSWLLGQLALGAGTNCNTRCFLNGPLRTKRFCFFNGSFLRGSGISIAFQGWVCF